MNKRGGTSPNSLCLPGLQFTWDAPMSNGQFAIPRDSDARNEKVDGTTMHGCGNIADSGGGGGGGAAAAGNVRPNMISNGFDVSATIMSADGFLELATTSSAC